METYDRILSLCKLKVKSDNIFSYELVEVPKELLFEAENEEVEICINSEQTQSPATVMYMMKRKSENFNYILMMEHKRLERFS